MLDGIPFGSTCGVVSDGSRNTERVAQLSLDFSLPRPGVATVATTGVRQNQQLGSTAMAARSFAFPPSGDGMGGEGRRVVNAVGDAHPAGIGAEVVIVHRH